MADLTTLVRLHKHELDEKRKELKKLYDELEKIEFKKQEIIDNLEKEKKLIKEAGGDVHFTFANFQEKSKLEIIKANRIIEVMEKQIFMVRDEMLDIFAEMKKYDMAQKERERIEAEEQRLKETKNLDEIAIEGFRNKE